MVQAAVVVSGAAGEAVTVNWAAPGTGGVVSVVCVVGASTMARVAVPQASCTPYN